MQEQTDDCDCEPILTPSLSFGKRHGDRLIPPGHFDSPQIIADVPREPPDEKEEEEEEDEFEFTFAIKHPEAGSPIAADEIFYDGRIRTVYPVFGRGLRLAEAAEEEEKHKPTRGPLRRLFFEERETSIGRSGSAEVVLSHLSGIPSDTYCLWTPGSSPGASPSRRQRSGPTGSLFRWSFRDLVMGRSQTDGKEKFVFFPAEKKGKEKSTKAKSVGIPRPRRSFDTKLPAPLPDAAVAVNSEGKDVVAARRSVGHAANEEEEGGRRQASLTYKEEELVGLFANVKGLRRTCRPV